MKVYGASVSYYTGKLETYLRYKGIAYERGSPYAELALIKQNVGCVQHPVVQRTDGRWMADSTPMIAQLETEHPDYGVMPEDPAMHFVALLIEDYADEWLWRAAMHYRWSYEHDRALLSRILADELTGHIRLPRFARRRMVAKRQLTGFVVNDGVSEATRGHVESGYHRILKLMSNALAMRPFLLGDRPSIADIGLMGPMLRHFGQDPTPAEIMRDTAPAVFKWVARMWNAGERTAVEAAGSFLPDVPADILPLLQEVCETHLVQLAENAGAWQNQQKKFAATVQGCRYEQLPVSRYRVHCLEVLRDRFAALDAHAQQQVRALLPHASAQVLWTSDIVAESGYDPEQKAPFNKAINVFENGVPA